MASNSDYRRGALPSKSLVPTAAMPFVTSLLNTQILSRSHDLENASRACLFQSAEGEDGRCQGQRLRPYL